MCRKEEEGDADTRRIGEFFDAGGGHRGSTRKAALFPAVAGLLSTTETSAA